MSMHPAHQQKSLSESLFFIAECVFLILLMSAVLEFGGCQQDRGAEPAGRPIGQTPERG